MQTPLSMELSKGNPDEKSPNLIRETEEENWETTENILVP